MQVQAANTSGRDVCARCGSGENLEAFDYHAFARRTDYVELPRSWRGAELLKIFQGRTVYHQLVQLSTPICRRCVWQMRRRRALGWALGISLLVITAAAAWKGYAKFWQDFIQANHAIDQLERARPSRSLGWQWQGLDSDQRQSRIFDEQECQLYEAKDRALLFAMPLRAVSLTAALLAILAVGLAVWDLQWERMGQRAAAAAVRPHCQRQGLHYVYPGHLPGGQPLSRRLP